MAFHTVPLLPSQTLAHRRRRELIESELPIPKELRLGWENDGTTTTTTRRRRRAYDVIPADNAHDSVKRVGGRFLEGEANPYETGALYQGYGTHYIDLWVGSPTPQRQTVIVDTGSSVTSFPCTGCRDCGATSDQVATGRLYHTDDVFRTGESDTYSEKSCRLDRGVVVARAAIHCDFGFCKAAAAKSGGNNRIGRCEVSVSYAEGSGWTALEGEDVVHPVGLHNVAGELETGEQRVSAVGGVDVMGEGDNDDGAGTSMTFDWSDFRLKFGCQEKVRLA
jgi:hypothetical protein